MGKKSRERREKFQTRAKELEAIRTKKNATFYDELKTRGLGYDGDIFTEADHYPSEAVIVANDIQSQTDLVKLIHYIQSSPEKAAKFYIPQIPFNQLFIECNNEITIHDMGGAGDYRAIGIHIEYEADDEYAVCRCVAMNDSGETEFMGGGDLMLGESAYFTDLSAINGHGSYSEDRLKHILYIAMQVLSLINCRNIELIDREPDPVISRQYQQHFGQPLITYKTLAIKPIGKRYESTADPKEYQGLMPLHLRRGNFAHYTEGAPLFGKYTGTFWRPSTAVGERKNGTVIKDYKVVAG